MKNTFRSMAIIVCIATATTSASAMKPEGFDVDPSNPYVGTLRDPRLMFGLLVGNFMFRVAVGTARAVVSSIASGVQNGASYIASIPAQLSLQAEEVEPEYDPNQDPNSLTSRVRELLREDSDQKDNS